MDFAVQLRKERVNPLASSLDVDFHVQRESMLEAAERYRMFNIIHRHAMLKVDMHVRPPEGIYAEEIRRARRLKLRTDPEGFADVATPEDTLLQKLRWYRLGGEVSDRQWRDVLGIMKVMGDELDGDYLRRWSVELRLHELLARALEEARAGRE